MPPVDPVARRLLLRHFAAGSTVVGTFLLPAALHTAMAARRHEPKRAPAKEPKPSPPLVMLDPGHGGKDPGAIGFSGTFEKQVALATALELKRQLEAGGHYRVVLTRSRDVFIALDDRVEQAQRHKAELFVSMHADALTDHSVRGASVYTLGQTASDAQSAALARKENSVDRLRKRRWRDTSPEVSRVLDRLVRQETLASSMQLARRLIGSLDQDLPMLPNPDRHAGFVVLQAAEIPSVLVEMGFMSNRHDEAALRQSSHRKLVAAAMRRAVDAFFVSRMA
jgi:N-acetylmuramoyl-L-alanine amidase